MESIFKVDRADVDPDEADRAEAGPPRKPQDRAGTTELVRPNSPDQRADRGVIVEVKVKGYHLDLGQATWLTSTRSGLNSDSRVEVAFVGEAVAVRDSKAPDGPALIFTPAEWDAFVGGAQDGEFDLW